MRTLHPPCCALQAAQSACTHTHQLASNLTLPPPEAAQSAHSGRESLHSSGYTTCGGWAAALRESVRCGQLSCIHCRPTCCPAQGQPPTSGGGAFRSSRLPYALTLQRAACLHSQPHNQPLRLACSGGSLPISAARKGSVWIHLVAAGEGGGCMRQHCTTVSSGPRITDGARAACGSTCWLPARNNSDGFAFNRCAEWRWRGEGAHIWAVQMHPALWCSPIPLDALGPPGSW